jgi:acetylornithine/succinyldiaminopimelate/putrescine aminotransferase
MTYTGTLDKAEVVDLYRRHVSVGQTETFTAAGIVFVKGRREGIRVWDLDGRKELIDLHCCGGVYNLGHRNPEIIATLRAALDELDIGNHHFISEQRALLARKLAQLTPGELVYTIYSVGGGEAVDLALRVARAYTGRSKVVSMRGGYHGHTGLAIATADERYRKPFGPLAPGFSQVPFNDVPALQDALDRDVAAVILETAPATLGMVLPDQGYLEQVRELCDHNGTVMIVDETQTGLGRTGKVWGIDHFQVVPDALVTAKGPSGGIYPITATCLRPELEQIFHADPFVLHGSTYGGAELGCAVFLKVLEICSDPGFLDHVNQMAALFEKGLAELKARFADVIVGIHQLGLFMGIETVDASLGLLAMKACFDNGLLCFFANNGPSVIQVLPPLVIQRTEVTEVMERLDGAFRQLQRYMQA